MSRPPRTAATAGALVLAALLAWPATAAAASEIAPAPPPPSAERGVIVAAASAIEPGSVNRTSLNLTATYSVKATLSWASRAFNTDTTITIRNDSGAGIDRVELNTIATRLGSMRLRVAAVDGRNVAATVSDQTIIVPFGGVLPAGQTAYVRIAYTSTLNSTLSGSNWLFTKANGIVAVHRWIPFVSVRRQFNRPNHGDPFVTPVSPSVKVVMTSDRTLVFAHPGDHIATSGLTKTFVATNVRDFAFTAAPDYRTSSAVVGDNLIQVFYRPGTSGSAILSAAKQAFPKMESLVGQYPYRAYRLAQSAGGYGMESPGLTWIPTGTASSNLRYLVHHETAHQWFYGIVGNDQATEPYNDEAAADFLGRYVMGARRASRCSTARLDLSIYAYSSSCYYEVIYIQGGNFLDDLRRSMGSTAFWTALRAYVAEQRFRITPTKTLLETLDRFTSLNLAPRYAPRFPRLY